MKIKEYLSKKYRVATATTITKAEAKMFGIPYPLTKGWLARHGDRDVSILNLAQLEKKMQSRATKQEKRHKKGAKHTRAAIAIIGQVMSAPVVKRVAQNSMVMGDAFLQTYEWRKLRMVALTKYGARCQCCGASPETGAVMNVDHIKPRRIYPELALDINNLQVLCDACNHGKGNWDMTDWRRQAIRI